MNLPKDSKENLEYAFQISPSAQKSFRENFGKDSSKENLEVYCNAYNDLIQDYKEN